MQSLRPEQGISPDRWVITVLSVYGETKAGLLVGWSGGYLDGDSFRRSTEVKTFEDTGDSFKAVTYSGSTYNLRKTAIGMNGIMGSVYSNLAELQTEDQKITLLAELVDVEKYFKVSA